MLQNTRKRRDENAVISQKYIQNKHTDSGGKKKEAGQQKLNKIDGGHKQSV